MESGSLAQTGHQIHRLKDERSSEPLRAVRVYLEYETS